MLVQGVGGGKDVTPQLEPVSLSGARATALALVFSRAAAERARARRATRARRARRGVTATSCSRSPTTATASPAEPRAGTGLSIVRALVRDELRGTLDLRSDGGTRAEVVFPV